MKTCPQCHTPLDEDAPEGLCPRCLAAAAFHSDPTMVTGGPEGLPDIANAEEVARRLPQYEILELLGRGGMGVVYKARQKQLDRIVALKILPPSDALSPDFIERFRREARSLAKLSHPNIVAIHDFGEAGGLYYFAMEYVDGANLREMLRTKKMTAAEALAVVPKICDALQYAHDEGVVHRDIKPENILVDLKGRVKIADFGLAKLLRRDDADQNLTLSGMALGTPRYMAPEQVDKPETVDHRADIYSLGVVFYEMLTGELPMGRFAPPSQKVQVDVRLDEIVLHALERDVERRYQRVGDVKTDVENVTGKPQFAPVPAIAPSPLSESQPPLDPRSMQPRFSGHAIVGAVWAVFGLLAILSGAYFVALSHVWNGTTLPTDLIHESPPTGFNIFMGALLVIGSGAFIGTPVLGAVAIGRIRRSEGRLIGLPLGIADVLFFPLLVLGAFAFWFTHLVQIAVWTKVHTAYINQPGNPEVIIAPPEAAYPGMSFMILDTVVALVICFVAAFAVWRSISNKIGKNPLPANGVRSEGDSANPRLSRLALVSAIWVGVGLLVGALIFVATEDAPPGKPDGILNLPMAFWAFFPISGIFASMILGPMAIARIRHSGGKLTGLRLATATALSYPLFLVLQIVTHAWDQGWGSGFGYEPYAELILEKAVAWLFWLGVFYPMVRSLWRRIAGPSDWQTPWFHPTINAESLTGKAALAVIFAAIGAYALPWYFVDGPGAKHAFTPTKIQFLEANESLLLLLVAIGASLFAVVPSLPGSTRRMIRGVGTLCILAALVIQVRFLLSLGEYETEEVGRVVREIRSYPKMGLYISIALTALSSLLCVLRFFEGKSAGKDEQVAGFQKEAAAIPAKVVRTPADLLVLVASIALLTAVGIGIWFWGQGALHPESGSAFGDNTPTIVPIKGGQMIVTGHQQGIIIKVSAVIIAFYGIIIGGAGLLMRRLRARIFVLISLVLAGLFLPAALAYNFISEHVPQWPIFAALWLGMPVCVWAVRLLFREKIREAFELAPVDSVDTATSEKPTGGLVWPLAVCLAGGIVCAFPCQRMTSGFWGMPWWSSETTGVGAMSVVPDSPAAKAGILQEDHVKELNGTKLTGGDTLFQMWKNLPVGAPVELKIERSGKPMTLTTRRDSDSVAGQFYWNWQIIAGHAFLVFGGLLLVAGRRPSLASGFSLIAGAGALVLLACVVPTVDATMVGPSLWKNAAFGEGGFEQWPWQRVTVVIVCGLLAVMSLGAISREAVEPDLVLGGAGLAAFGISLAWGICRLTGTMTNLEWAAILLTILTAIGVAVLFPRPRRGEPGSMRSKMPEMVLVLLGAGVGALPWTHTLLPASGWQFWHGGIFSMIYFVLGLVLLASGGSRPAPWMGVVTILAALGAFACAFAFTTWPPEWHLFSDGTGTGKVKTLMAGVFIAYGLSVLTAAMGALQIRAAAGNSPSAAHE